MNMSSKEINRMHTPNFSDILIRLKSVFSANSDAELSKALNTSAQTISSWKSRNHIPYATCVDLAIQKNLSLDWLIWGRTDKHPSASPAFINESGDTYAITSDSSVQKLLTLFRELTSEQQANVLQVVQEKHQVMQMQQQIKQLQAEILRLKKMD